MSKNLTRKSVAIGAALALGTTLFAGAPAQAANEVTLAPNVGTSYGMILGDAFTLKASLGATIASGAYGKMKFKVANATAASLTATPSQTSAGATGVAQSFSNTSKVVEFTNESGSVSTATLAISSAASASHTVGVTAWLDTDGNDVIDAGEFSSGEVTVSFVKESELTTNVTVAAGYVADTTISAKFTVANVNNEQLDALDVLAIKFTEGDDTALHGSNTNLLTKNTTPAVTWNTTDKVFEVTSQAVTALTKGEVVKAQLLHDAAGSASATFVSDDYIGAAAYGTVTARKIAAVTAYTVRSATALATEKNADITTNDVKRNSAFELQVVAKDDSTPAVGVSGSAVEVTITTSATLSSATGGKTLTVNGTTYTDNAKLPGTSATYAKIKTTTDSKGVAKISVSTAGFAAGDDIIAAFKVENFTRTAVANQAEAAYTGYITENNADLATFELSGVSKSTWSIGVSVYDQFGGVPADSYDASIKLTSDDSARGATTASNKNAAIVNGKATLTVTDNGTSDGVETYDVAVFKRADGGGYIAAGGTDAIAAANNIIDTINVNYVPAAQLVAGVVTSAVGTKNTAGVYVVSGTTDLALDVDAGNHDFRSVLGTIPAPGAAVSALSGTVTTAAGSPIKGASVTLAATGVQFKVNGKDVFGLGSITIKTDGNGAWAVDVASNNSGAKTVVVTSGSATASIKVTFAQAKDDTAETVTVTAPKTVKVGKSFIVTVLLTDGFGNPVTTDSTATNYSNGTTDPTFSVTYDGPGLVTSTIAQKTDANGKVTFRVIPLSAETGLGTVSVSYDSNGTADDVAGTTLTAASTNKILVGITASVSAGSKKANVVVKGAEGLTVKVVSGAKVTTKTATSDNYKLSLTKLTAGKKTVKVYVNDVLVSSKSVTVKR